jgi:hypothetical protein
MEVWMESCNRTSVVSDSVRRLQKGFWIYNALATFYKSIKQVHRQAFQSPCAYYSRPTNFIKGHPWEDSLYVLPTSSTITSAPGNLTTNILIVIAFAALGIGIASTLAVIGLLSGWGATCLWKFLESWGFCVQDWVHESWWFSQYCTERNIYLYQSSLRFPTLSNNLVFQTFRAPTLVAITSSLFRYINSKALQHLTYCHQYSTKFEEWNLPSYFSYFYPSLSSSSLPAWEPQLE